MINNLEILIPEIFLSLSIFSLLMIGVFIKESYNLVTKLSLLVIIICIFLITNNEATTEKIFLDSFIKDGFSNFIKILILVSSFFVLNSSQEFIKDNKIAKFEYPIIILILGMFFMVSSNDLILFYLGLELQSLALYILASIDRDNLRSTEAGLKYFILSALSSGLLLYGCSLLYGFTGSTNFNVIASELTSENVGSIFAMVFILVGLAFKISAVPFHMWTPDVYEGSPTSVTSFFAVAPKVAGLAVLIRFMQTPFANIIIEWQTIVIFISIASMILGSLAAIGQKNIKRLMAYSSISHIGYALAGVATGTISGYASSIIYITIYVVMNIGAFACIFLMKKEGKYKEEINDLSGISKNHPLIAMSFLIILFSLAGVPPLGGFFAKFYIFISVIDNEMYMLAIIGLLSTVISAFYYDDMKKPLDQVRNINITSTVLISCIILISFFLYPALLNDVVYTILS